MRVLNVILSGDGRVELLAEGERQANDPVLSDDRIDKAPRQLAATQPDQLFSALFNLPLEGEALYQGPWKLRFRPRQPDGEIQSVFWKLTHPDGEVPLFKLGWTLAEVHRPAVKGVLPGASINVLGGGEVLDALVRAFPGRARSVSAAEATIPLEPGSIVIVTDPRLCAGPAEIQRAQTAAAQSRCPMIVWCIADTPRNRSWKPKVVEISPTGFHITTMAWYANWLPHFLRGLDEGTPLEEAFAAACEEKPAQGSSGPSTQFPPLRLQNTCLPPTLISRSDRGRLSIPISWQACIDRHTEEKAVVGILKEQLVRKKASVHVVLCYGGDKKLLEYFLERLNDPPDHLPPREVDATWDLVEFPEGSPRAWKVARHVNHQDRLRDALGRVISVHHPVQTLGAQQSLENVDLYLKELRDSVGWFQRSAVVVVPLHCPTERWLGLWQTNRWIRLVENLDARSVPEGGFSFTRIHLKDGPIAPKNTPDRRQEEDRLVEEVIESVERLQVPLTDAHRTRLKSVKEKSLHSMLTILDKELGPELKRLEKIRP